jgi:hypothetical protein
MADTQKLTNEVDALVESVGRLSREAATSGRELGPERIEELSSIAARGGQLIRRLYGIGSQYDQNFQRVLATTLFTSMHSYHYSHVSELAGILRGVQHDLNSGMLFDLRLLLQAEIFADFLDMAEHLLNSRYKDAAAVLLGAVLEDSLRKLAQSSGVATTGTNGKPLTIDPLNAALAKTDVYGPLVQKQITTWANLRNDAAHGNFSKYDNEQVGQMLLFVQKFCADFLGRPGP